MEKEKIFIIEDSPEILSLISDYVKNAGFDPLSFSAAGDALKSIPARGVAAVILDMDIKGMGGMEFIKRFRTDKNSMIPLIAAGKSDADDDITGALYAGADEYVTKPFSPRVLIARLEAMLRRLKQTEAAAEESVQFGEYTVLENSCVLKRGSIKVRLSSREFDVLDYLVHHANQNLTPEKIFTEVWKVQYGDISAVAVYIQRLRKKIEKDPKNPQYIKTVFKYGYMFELPEKT